ncbi:MAG: phage baseplate assembly protein V, partial [Bacteroidota bacterium]
VGINISIEGKHIKQFSSFALSQHIFNHHSFRLVCPTEAIDGESGTIFHSSKDMIGGSFNVKIDAVGGTGSLQFSGVITEIEAARHSGHAGDIIISGYSPTILLDNGPHCKSWEKKAVKNIAQDILRHFPQNLLQPKIAPSYGETLSYTVQYKETAWQFLCRLSATYGEWLYYDGQKLMLGPPQGSSIKLLYGSTLHHFSMALQVRPASFQMMAYDYMNNEVYDGAPSGIAAKAGLSELGKHTLHKSEKFYAVKPKQWHNQFLTNKKQLDDFVNTRASMQSSNMVRFNGSSDHPALQVGGGASIEGRNVYNHADESFGDYTIISVEHHCDGQGNYSNSFVAIPASVKMPPLTAYAEPHCETQSALVTDNYDPKGLGRVRVRFHWMNDTEKSPWLRVTSPHGGDGKGMFFIPEVGEEVIVGFEGDSPVKPYIIGTVYHGKAKTDFSNNGNDVKALQTRSGNMIVMNDAEGSVHVADAKGNNVKMDGGGNINVTASDNIVLTCGDAKIEMKKDGTINITGKKIIINADDQAVLESKQAKFTADGGGNEATMEGMKAAVKGTTETKIDGAQTTVSASAKVTVQAAMIMLN